MEMHVDAILSALFGTGVTTLLAKALIGRSLGELEQVSRKITEIKSELAAISVKLQVLDRDRDVVSKHDRKIAAMENELYGHGQPRKIPTSC